MSEAPRYLSPDVALEPLVSGWYAQPQLLPPVTSAQVLAHAQLPRLRSFASRPELHVEAVRSAGMAAGAFMDLPASAAPRVRELIAQIERDDAVRLQLAAAIQELERLLEAEKEALGFAALYPRLPPPLRGYVELRYDVRHRPSARYLEGLLYRSPFYREGAQSVLMGRITGDARPFALNTPRLAREDQVELHAPFASPELARLFRMRDEPGDVEALASALRVPQAQRALFAGFFTDRPPRQSPRHQGVGLRVRYFGHAALLIESPRACVLTDPGISYDYPATPERLTLSDLPPRIDCVLITHAHADHLALETLLQLRHRVDTVVVPKSGGGPADPSLKLMLSQLGFGRVVELDEMEGLELPGGAVTALPFLGEHADLEIRSKAAYLIRLEGKGVVCAADSNPLDPVVYDRVHDAIGEIEVLCLGMESVGAPLTWAYGPMLPAPPPRKVDQARRLNGADFAGAVQIIERLRPRRVLNYAMGLEPWLSHVMGLAYTPESKQLQDSDRLLAWCKERGISAERPYCRFELQL